MRLKETLVYTKCGRTLTWRQSEEFSHSKGVQSKATASPHQKKLVEVMQACFGHFLPVGDPGARPRTHCRDYICLAWKQLGLLLN